MAVAPSSFPVSTGYHVPPTALAHASAAPMMAPAPPTYAVHPGMAGYYRESPTNHIVAPSTDTTSAAAAGTTRANDVATTTTSPAPSPTYYIRSKPISFPAGSLGLSVEFDKNENLAIIKNIHTQTCPSKVKALVQKGDRIITINGERLTSLDALEAGSDKPRSIIIAREMKEKSTKAPISVTGADHWKIKAEQQLYQILDKMPHRKCYPIGSSFSGYGRYGDLDEFICNHRNYTERSVVFDDFIKSGYWFIEYDKDMKKWTFANRERTNTILFARIAKVKRKTKRQAVPVSEYHSTYTSDTFKRPLILSIYDAWCIFVSHTNMILHLLS